MSFLSFILFDSLLILNSFLEKEDNFSSKSLNLLLNKLISYKYSFLLSTVGHFNSILFVFLNSSFFGFFLLFSDILLVFLLSFLSLEYEFRWNSDKSLFFSFFILVVSLGPNLEIFLAYLFTSLILFLLILYISMLLLLLILVSIFFSEFNIFIRKFLSVNSKFLSFLLLFSFKLDFWLINKFSSFINENLFLFLVVEFLLLKSFCSFFNMLFSFINEK